MTEREKTVVTAIACFFLVLLVFLVGLFITDPVWRCDHYLETWKSNAEGTIERVNNFTVCGFDRDRPALKAPHD